MITEEIKTLLRAIADEKQMQLIHYFTSGDITYEDCHADIAIDYLGIMCRNKGRTTVRIKPEPKRMYGHWTGDYWHFEDRIYGCEKFYFDIDPDTNEPIGEIKRIEK